MPKNRHTANRFKKSQTLFARAVGLMPGGVSSPVRSFKSVGLPPVFIHSGEGAFLVDVDSNRYIDYVMSYGPLIHGHAHPALQAALAKQSDRGTSFGCCCEEEVTLATMIAAAMPHVPMVRFVNSGAEAVMSAIRLARGVTGRPIIVKIAGGYHGAIDALLVEAGSGATTHGHPSSPGIPPAVTADTLVLPFNDLPEIRRAFQQHGERIAAIVLELVMGNIGVVPPADGYLQELRELCDRHGALLVADEVMTGFRLARGGAQELLHVRPDLTCLGKIIGGGLPVGAFGGRSELMNHISPAGPVYQAGTLSGNPLAMAAGIAALRLLETDEPYQRLESLGQRLQSGLEEVARKAGVALVVQRYGSMITPFFPPVAKDAGAFSVRNYADALRCDTRAFALFFKAMLAAGVMIPPSQFEAWFLSLAHTPADIDATIDKAAAALAALAAGTGLNFL